MFRVIFKKLHEALIGVVPVTIIILIVNITTPMKAMDFWSFLFGAGLLIVGLTLYSFGSGSSIEFMGKMIGNEVSKSKKRGVILGICGAIGVIVTIAEPDLSVLAAQVNGIPNMVLILSIAIGVGIFAVIAVVRLMFRVGLKWVLIFFYGLIFVLAFALPSDFVPLAFDSSGVTTGPLTVPFIMALGASLSVAFGGKDSQDSSFGIVGICSIGPILAVMILSLFLSPDVESEVASAEYANFSEVLWGYAQNLPHYLKEMAIALSPILVFFLIYNFVAFKLSAKSLLRTVFGAVYVYLGLAIFLLGANMGFVPAGRHIGSALVEGSGYMLIVVGVIVGAVIVLAEPAVHVLTREVEEVTGGVIKRKAMLAVMCLSMAISVGLAMTRIIFDINIMWVLAIGYGAALLLTFVVPKIFTGIAFDSGGVASGAMTAAFLLPMASGATYALYGDSPEIGSYIMRDAFGAVALVAMTPLVAIQVLGLVFRLRTVRARRARTEELAAMLARDGEVIELAALEREMAASPRSGRFKRIESASMGARTKGEG